VIIDEGQDDICNTLVESEIENEEDKDAVNSFSFIELQDTPLVQELLKSSDS
tara:strand:+ start:519 stop:674 length:156 start_codon:yes stop_codon:yes gene_type:complete